MTLFARIGAVAAAAALASAFGCKEDQGGEKKAPETPTVETSNGETTPAKKTDDGAGEDFRLYHVETGIITEKTKTAAGPGVAIEEEKKTYFIDWGRVRTEHKKTVTKVGGRVQTQRSVTRIEGAVIKNIDLERKKGTVTRSPIDVAAIAKRIGAKDPTELARRMLEQTGATKGGTAELLGRPVDIYKSERLGLTTWLWLTIPLRVIAKPVIGGPEVETVVTKLEIDVPIPADKIELDPSIELVEVKMPHGIPGGAKIP